MALASAVNKAFQGPRWIVVAQQEHGVGMETILGKTLASLVTAHGAAASGWAVALMVIYWHLKDKHRIVERLIAVLSDNTAANVSLAAKFDVLTSILRERTR